AAAVFAMPSTSRHGGLTGRSSAVKDRDARGPGCIQQFADLPHTLPAFLTTAVAVFFDRVKDGFGDIAHEIVVDIHHNDRWSAAKALSLAVPSGGEHLPVPLRQHIIPNGHMGLLCAAMPNALRGYFPYGCLCIIQQASSEENAASFRLHP